ncbi:MAG: multicopper oxidase domain-containing protein [bacterium]
MSDPANITRRDVLVKAGKAGLGIAFIAGTSLSRDKTPGPAQAGVHGSMKHGAFETVSVGTEASPPPTDFAPMDAVRFLTAFDYGKVSRLPDGRPLREFLVVAKDIEQEVAHGVKVPLWSFNGFVPGPTMRATEGDRIRVHFYNQGSHPHTIHFHGVHPAGMDGVLEVVEPGRHFVYEFDAEPFGLHLYHCHTLPVKKHIMKGLYGALLIDPKVGRPPAKELVMVMNGFDTDFDNENEFYTVNGFANIYAEKPIRLTVNELVRVYLVNVTEFDLINSMHIHANFFQVYPTGTSLTPSEYTDTIMLCQGQRAILEFTYKYSGKYMFHAHQSEFAELGWNGFFDVVEGGEG